MKIKSQFVFIGKLFNELIFSLLVCVFLYFNLKVLTHTVTTSNETLETSARALWTKVKAEKPNFGMSEADFVNAMT